MRLVAILSMAVTTTAITTVALAGCSGASRSSSSAPSRARPSQTASGSGDSWADRFTEAPGLLIQCGVTHGTIKPPKGQPWYRYGRVLPLSGSRAASVRDAEQSSWWDAHKGIAAGGKTLASWSEWAAGHDRLPPAVCGYGVSAARLAAQIYPGPPNPWG